MQNVFVHVLGKMMLASVHQLEKQFGDIEPSLKGQGEGFVDMGQYPGVNNMIPGKIPWSLEGNSG
jgi:hypothetical protein